MGIGVFGWRDYGRGAKLRRVELWPPRAGEESTRANRRSASRISRRNSTRQCNTQTDHIHVLEGDTQPNPPLGCFTANVCIHTGLCDW